MGVRPGCRIAAPDGRTPGLLALPLPALVYLVFACKWLAACQVYKRVRIAHANGKVELRWGSGLQNTQLCFDARCGSARANGPRALSGRWCAHSHGRAWVT